MWWDIVCLDKRKGGLVVKRLSTLNKALLSKWNWLFAIEKGALWNCVISGKYREEEVWWCSREMREGFCVGVWKVIRKE